MLEEERDSNPYLQQEVLTASPVRLRWLLITRAKELCEGVEGLWSQGQIELADQWLVRIREILGELLAGVTDGNAASIKVADFYLFLLKVLTEAEQSREMDRLATLKDLLAYEADTWQLLLKKLLLEANETESPNPVAPKPHLPAPFSSLYDETDDFSPGSSFSLDV